MLCFYSVVYSFLLLNNIPLYEIYYRLFIHASVDGHLRFSQFLAIINKASMNLFCRSFHGHVLSLLLGM